MFQHVLKEHQMAADPIGDALVRFPHLNLRFGIPYDRSTIYKKRLDGSFPEPLRLSPGTIAWRVSDIEEWLASRPRVGQPEPAPKPKAKKRAAPVRRGVATRKKHAAEGVQP
jgi:predicted DNA-binding transcriptional regulator AlpA